MSEKSSLDRNKAHLDLWIHQNNLLWGRYTLLLQLQAAIFALVYALHFRAPTQVTAAVAAVAALAGALLTLLLWICLEADITIRDQHAQFLSEQNGFVPTLPLTEKQDFIGHPPEKILHQTVFWGTILIDVVLAIVALFDVERLAP